MPIARTFLLLGGLSGLIWSVAPVQADILEVSTTSTQPPNSGLLATVAIFGQAWRNSFASLTGFTFAGYGNDFVDLNYPSGLTIDGVTFEGSGGYLYVRQESSAYFYGSDFLYGPPEPSGDISVMLPPNVYSVGWSWGNFYDVEGTTVTFADGESFTQSGIFGFVGFTSPDPIASFEISSPTFPVLYDEFSFEELPEPSYRLSIFCVLAILVSIRIYCGGRLPLLPERALPGTGGMRCFSDNRQVTKNVPDRSAQSGHDRPKLDVRLFGDSGSRTTTHFGPSTLTSKSVPLERVET